MRILPALLATAAILGATANTAHADEYVMMKVNGEDVSSEEVQAQWQGLFPGGQAPAFSALQPEMRAQILRGVMTEQLLLQEAKKKGLDNSADVQRQLEMARKKLAVKALLNERTASNVSEKEIRAAYDEMVEALKGEKELKASHILVPTEKEAETIKAQLEDGKKFAALAQEFSKDPGSAAQGGDLGYFTKDKMVTEFSEAAFDMDEGDISEPVKTDFGWHIIKLVDKRDATPPTYNQAKPAIKSKLQEKQLESYIEGLVNNAEVTVYDESGDAIDFDKNIPERDE